MTPHYVVRVNYKAKGMIERAKEQRRIDPRSFPSNCPYDHRFHTMFQFDFYHSVILSRNPVVSKSQWIAWMHIREQKKPSLDIAIATCERIGVYGLCNFSITRILKLSHSSTSLCL
jgi:hypothetical protein